MALMLALLPLFALLYDQWELIAPGLGDHRHAARLLARAPPWIYYRDMRFARQRLLEAVDPIVAFVVSIVPRGGGLRLLGLVIGLFCGAWSAALVAIACRPIRSGWRWSAATARRPSRFLAAVRGERVGAPDPAGVGAVRGERRVGLAGVGRDRPGGRHSTAYTDRVDQVITGRSTRRYARSAGPGRRCCSRRSSRPTG